MTLYLIIAIIVLAGVISLLLMDRRAIKKTLTDMTADKVQLLKNIAALKQNAVDTATIAAWKKDQEAKIEAGKADTVISDIIAGNNARVRDGKATVGNTP